MKTRLGIISDFNATLLERIASNEQQGPLLEAHSCDYGQRSATLIQAQSPFWKNCDAAFIWTRPQEVSAEFLAADAMQPVDASKILQDIDRFVAQVCKASTRVKHTFVASWHLPPTKNGYGLLECKPGFGLRALLATMNQHLAQALDQVPGVYVLDSQRWLWGPSCFADKMWYLTKVPYSTEVFKRAIRDIKSALQSLRGRSRKVIICDLDNTLWGGVVGDLGWQELKLGGHDPIGEAFVDVQKRLRALARRGVLLGIVSKNTESVALQAIQEHPEMILRPDDFAGWKINWKDKAANVSELLHELNLGIDAAVFLDDNPVERARVAQAHPQVLVPELPSNPLLYPSLIESLSCFDTPTLSPEDRARGAMYQAQRARLGAKEKALEVQTLEEWLVSLEVEVRPETLQEANALRCAQLLNKTNQMNLRTRRMTVAELSSWEQCPQNHLWAYRVSDKFGDSGIAALASVSIADDLATVEDFVLSCRVMGKGVEEAVLYHLFCMSRQLGAARLRATYRQSPRNLPCKEFFERSCGDDHGDMDFHWETATPFQSAGQAKIIEPEALGPKLSAAS